MPGTPAQEDVDTTLNRGHAYRNDYVERSQEAGMNVFSLYDIPTTATQKIHAPRRASKRPGAPGQSSTEQFANKAGSSERPIGLADLPQVKITENELAAIRPNVPRLGAFVKADPSGVNRDAIFKSVRLSEQEVTALKGNRPNWNGPQKLCSIPKRLSEESQATINDMHERFFDRKRRAFQKKHMV
jgi:hypothetical protein